MEIIFTAPAGGPPERLQGALGHYGITDRRFCRGFRRAVILHVTALRLFLRATVAQPDLVLIGIDFYDLEFVIPARVEQAALPRARALPRGLRLIALGSPLVDLRNVAQTFDHVRNLHK